MAALGVGLFAPKLVPIAYTMARFPRWIESTEAIGPGQLWVMLTAREQGVIAKLAPVPTYGWHEWGIYVGVAGVAVLAASVLALRTRRGRALWLPAVLLFVLGFGAFGSFAPWTLLHHLPPFAAQHVPSRFFFPAVLLLAVATAHGLGRIFDGRLARHPGVDLAATLVVGWLALDLANVGARATDGAFRMRATAAPPAAVFHHAETPSRKYEPDDAWGGAALLSRAIDEGVLECSGAPDGARPRGARSAADPLYRGETFLDGAPGVARVVSRTPNGIDVVVEATGPGTLVVNMNFDPGWEADGAPAKTFAHALATSVEAGSRVVRFRYRPRGLWLGLVLFAGAVAAATALLRREA
jgi:hypothetical protein